jgi:hypothetical protein
LAEQAKPMGGGTESLTRQDRLLCVLVENFQPVWREIEEAGVFRRRGLVSREGLLVPQHVMIGLVMLSGLLSRPGTAYSRGTNWPPAVTPIRIWLGSSSAG